MPILLDDAHIYSSKFDESIFSSDIVRDLKIIGLQMTLMIRTESQRKSILRRLEPYQLDLIETKTLRTNYKKALRFLKAFKVTLGGEK